MALHGNSTLDLDLNNGHELRTAIDWLVVFVVESVFLAVVAAAGGYDGGFVSLSPSPSVPARPSSTR